MGVTHVTIQLPEDVARDLSQGQDLAYAVLEAVALEGYRSGKLMQSQVRRLLGYQNRMEVDGLLKQHGVFLEYSHDDLVRESAIGDRSGTNATRN